MNSPSSITPVILCGGTGTRLWPLSRQSYPKQFTSILGEQSLFQQSALRFSGEGFAPPLVVSGEAFRFIISEQLSAVGMTAADILIEPEGRNTAPAILAAALWLQKHNPNTLMLVAPSDHIIPDTEAFQAAVNSATQQAQGGSLATFGIHPTSPETGYGYLELPQGSDTAAHTPIQLQRFVEKPNLSQAEHMIASGNYLWNAGIFLFSVQAILAAFQRLAPNMIEPVSQALQNAQSDLDFTRLDAQSWAQAESISIDYAIMEKSDNLIVMPFSAGWSDLGDWASVWRESPQDLDGNACTPESTTPINCRNTLLRTEGEGLHIVGIGLEDTIVVATPDAILVAPKSASQQVGKAVEALRKEGVKQANASSRDARPWGWYETIALGERFQVKRIFVKPHASLSLQSHKFRAEHWIVVAGTATVTIDETISTVTENQSIYVPLGSKHRLENTGDTPVMLIEVQTGSYFGEDDIVRYEDVYARL